ncbi:MAG: hypothetical protein J5I94_21840, partial [Phaeodactylibacter sp.]|nr:hypothetical protein [Phaeodactylibacter sp.]
MDPEEPSFPPTAVQIITIGFGAQHYTDAIAAYSFLITFTKKNGTVSKKKGNFLYVRSIEQKTAKQCCGGKPKK